MKYIATVLLLLLFSCNQERSVVKTSVHSKHDDSTINSDWNKHTLRLQEDLGAVTLYLPKVFDTLQFVDSMPEPETGYYEYKCQLESRYQFRPKNYPPLALEYHYFGEPFPDSSFTLTISYRTFPDCDTYMYRHLSTCAFDNIEEYLLYKKDLDKQTGIHTYFNPHSKPVINCKYPQLVSTFKYDMDTVHQYLLYSKVFLPRNYISFSINKVCRKEDKLAFKYFREILSTVVIH